MMLYKQGSATGLSQSLNSLHNYHWKSGARKNLKPQEKFSFLKSIFQLHLINLLESWKKNLRTGQLGQDKGIHEAITWKI